MMRYGRRWHVFINHGESDKMYMTTNQFKAYDYAFIAGDAARSRLEKLLWDYDFDEARHPDRSTAGRPLLDGAPLPYTPDDRDVVLYAPTWEGDRECRGLRVDRDARRAPRAGPAGDRPASGDLPAAPALAACVDPEYGAANRAIIAAIAAANAADPSAQHVFDDGPKLGWQLAAADVAIVDISAMVYDRLATGKPLLITRPAEPDGADRHRRLPAGLRVARRRRMPRRRSPASTRSRTTPTRSSDWASGWSATSATRLPG